MNKFFIQKLKTQALLYAQEKCEGKTHDINGVLRSDIMSDKFAELIVLECSKWMKSVRGEYGDRISDSYYWASKLEDHFGIK